jgi:hypothetical protein
MADILGMVVTGCAMAAEKRRLNRAWLANLETFDVRADFGDDA